MNNNLFSNFKLWLRDNHEYSDDFLSLNIPYLISLFIKSKNLYLINNIINNFYLAKVDKKELLLSIKDLLKFSDVRESIFFNIKKENKDKENLSKLYKLFPYYKKEELEIVLKFMNKEDKEIIDDINDNTNKKINKKKNDKIDPSKITKNKSNKKKIKTFKEWSKCFGN